MYDQFKNFVENQPLLTKEIYDEPFKKKDIAIRFIDYDCYNCGTSRVFNNSRLQTTGGGAGLSRVGTPNDEVNYGFHYFYFQCTACSAQIQFWIEYRNDDRFWIRKLGQFPPWKIEIERELEYFLDDEAVFLKKGKVCLSQSYGLGACAYFRRVLENEIEPLLKLLIDKKSEEGVDPEKIEEYGNICKGKDFSSKTRLALKIAPKSLIIDGINPFKIIHDFLSKGIHSRTEEDCQVIAMKILNALEFVVIELNREKEHRKKFIRSLKELEKENN